jgi:hypothetical protein
MKKAIRVEVKYDDNSGIIIQGNEALRWMNDHNKAAQIAIEGGIHFEPYDCFPLGNGNCECEFWSRDGQSPEAVRLSGHHANCPLCNAENVAKGAKQEKEKLQINYLKLKYAAEEILKMIEDAYSNPISFINDNFSPLGNLQNALVEIDKIL